MCVFVIGMPTMFYHVELCESYIDHSVKAMIYTGSRLVNNVLENVS